MLKFVNNFSELSLVIFKESSLDVKTLGALLLTCKDFYRVVSPKTEKWKGKLLVKNPFPRVLINEGLFFADFYVVKHTNVFHLDMVSNENSNRKELRGKFCFGKRVGKWRVSDGSILSTGEYKNDKKEGKWKIHYIDSQETLKGNYVDGKRQGLWKGKRKGINGNEERKEFYYKEGVLATFESPKKRGRRTYTHF